MMAINGFAQLSEKTSVSSGIWVEVGAGGSYYPNQDDQGNFAWEGGLGINISPKTSIGAFYNDQVIYDEHIRFVGIRFSV